MRLPGDFEASSSLNIVLKLKTFLMIH